MDQAHALILEDSVSVKMDACVVEQMRIQDLIISNSSTPVTTKRLLEDLADSCFDYAHLHNILKTEGVYEQNKPFWKKFRKI